MSKRQLLTNEEDYYGRNLPHWQPENAVLFMTTRLYGSLPKRRVEELRERREAEVKLLKAKGLSKAKIQAELRKIYDLYFNKFDALLDRETTGPHWLKEPAIAKIWNDALFHFDNDRYQVICSTIMSNHAHFIFFKLDRSLGRIMKTMKGFSGYAANKILDRTGYPFWQIESFDRMIRDRAELRYRINYVLNNPIEVGLAKHWKDWPYNYIHPDFLKFVDE
ncbi:MAG: hypothetical protein AAF960_21115 [Bacteroidota bacterium]